jgi:F0F1-type ATP synthase membrane subunit c/vacuolar-type H+-ATPase subunit K
VLAEGLLVANGGSGGASRQGKSVGHLVESAAAEEPQARTGVLITIC